MSKQKTGTGKFGWCLTRQHDQCWKQFQIKETGVVHTCTCDCHKEETE